MTSSRSRVSPASGQAEVGCASPSPASAGQVLRRFRLVFGAVRSHFLQVERKVGISGAQLWALSVIGGRDAITVGRLASEMDIHQTTASNLVRQLKAGGLVVGTRDAADRRAINLSLTTQGRELLRAAPGPAAGVLPDALARLDPATLARLDRDLGTLLELLGADARAAKIPLSQL